MGNSCTSAAVWDAEECNVCDEALQTKARDCDAKPGSKSRKRHKKSAGSKTRNPKPVGSAESKDKGYHSRVSRASEDWLSECSTSGRRLRDEFVLEQKLGEGRFGVVRACRRRVDGAQLACKSISSQAHGDALVEAQVLERLQGCDCVVRLEAVFESSSITREAKGGSCGDVHVVMQRCYGGTIADRLARQGRFSEAEAARVIRTVLRVLAACHSQGLIYRDVKDTNFLFLTDAPDSAVLGIDFGLAVSCSPGMMLSEVAGSPLYIAPEVVKRAYGPQCDVWSAGVLLYQMLSGRHPFQRESLTETLKAVTRAEYDMECEPWPAVSAPAKHLLTCLLNKDPSQRLTSLQALDHPWLTTASSKLPF